MAKQSQTVELPFLQHEGELADRDMWNVKDVMCALKKLGAPEEDPFREQGTQFKDQGCQICCLAMVLHLLDEKAHASDPWTPEKVLDLASDERYLTKVGLSLVPLYADLCVDATRGRVQLCAKENYAPAQGEFLPQRLSNIFLVHAYRGLKPSHRSDFVVMLRIGTHDESYASHYLLIDPNDKGLPDSDDVLVLDPDMPIEERGKAWTFQRASDKFFRDRDLNPDEMTQIDDGKVSPGDVAAVYVFARWRSAKAGTLLGALAKAIAAQE